jgi:RNA polymerase primary sigma factor
MGQTPKLNAQEEKTLGSRIEQGKYLSQLESDLRSQNGSVPAATDIMIELLQRFCDSGDVFPSICEYCQLNPQETIIKNASDITFHRAIDGYLDPKLVEDAALMTGLDNINVEQKLIQLSLSNLLIDWSIIESVNQGKTISGLVRVIKSKEFRKYLDINENRFRDHLNRIIKSAQEADNHLVTANLRLVVSIAGREYRPDSNCEKV